MPLIWTIREGDGIRIDETDVWIVQRIREEGASADVVTPEGRLVTLRENIWYRVGPGFRMSLGPHAPSGHVNLVVESYVPLMHRHPPRSHKRAPEQQSGVQ